VKWNAFLLHFCHLWFLDTCQSFPIISFVAWFNFLSLCVHVIVCVSIIELVYACRCILFAKCIVFLGGKLLLLSFNLSSILLYTKLQMKFMILEYTVLRWSNL